jgi:hypothetical protein
MKQLVIAAVVVIAACSKKDGASKPADPKAVPTATGSGSAAGSAAPAPTTEDACAEPCRLLRDATIDAVRTQCPDWSLGKQATAGCDLIDFTRNCIYATYGYAFKKPRYQKAFGALAWYKPDPAFAESAMSKQAITNVAELKKLGAVCRAHGEDEISPQTRAAVEAWFAARAKGAPPIPDKVTDLDGNTVGKDVFVAHYLGKDSTLFIKDAWEPIVWVERRGKAEVVTVATGVPNPATCTTGDEDCEGFEALTFVVEAGTITELIAGAAG